MMYLSTTDIRILLKVKLDAGRHTAKQVLEGEDNIHVRLLIDEGHLEKCGVGNNYLRTTQLFDSSVDYILKSIECLINNSIHLAESDIV